MELLVMIVYEDLQRDFTQTPNSLYNPNISLPAKGLYGELRSLIRTWNILNTNLAKRLGISLKTLDKYLTELIQCGWISRAPRRKTNGQFKGGYDYILHNSPQTYIEERVISPVDNSDSIQGNSPAKDTGHNQISPDRQNFLTNKTQIINIQKTTNGISDSFSVHSSEYSEIEIEAAKQYTDSQKGVRDRDAYILATLKHGWHKLILKKARNTIIAHKFKELDLDLSKQLYAQIRKKLLNSDAKYEPVARQILNPGRLILGHPSKNLSPHYFTTLYNLQVTNPELCVFEVDEPEYAYLDLFAKLKSNIRGCQP